MLSIDNPINNAFDSSRKMSSNNSNSSDSALSQEDEIMRNINLYLNGVLLLTICIVGVLSNVLVMRVLVRRSMRSSTNVYLLSLAIFDTLILLSTLFNICLPEVSPDFKENALPKFLLIVYPIALTAQTFAIWITVCFTVERYIAVCHPLKAISLCTVKRARIVIVGVLIFSILYNISRWFEYAVNINSDGKWEIKETLMAKPVYKHIYYSGMYLILMNLLPVLLLAVFNTLLIIAVNKSIKQRQAMRASDSKENNLTILLITVVLVFIVCQTPALIYNVAIQFCDSKKFGWQVLSEVRDFMVTLNSAINFLLYCALGEKFRKEFWLSVTEVCKCVKKSSKKNITHGGMETSATRKYTNGYTGKYTQVSIVDSNENEEEAML